MGQRRSGDNVTTINIGRANNRITACGQAICGTWSDPRLRRHWRQVPAHTATHSASDRCTTASEIDSEARR